MRKPQTREERIENDYLYWMRDLVRNPGMTRGNGYLQLLRKLHEIPFHSSLYMDENRAEDGRELRYRFGYERGYSNEEIGDTLDRRQDCSMLEMMVALSLRIEENIMHNDEEGNRIGVWFWNMIASLGLMGEYDGNFYAGEVESAVRTLRSRWYDRDGRGGLFTVRRSQADMRTMEIWYQMNEWLNEYLEEKGE